MQQTLRMSLACPYCAERFVRVVRTEKKIKLNVAAVTSKLQAEVQRHMRRCLGAPEGRTAP